MGGHFSTASAYIYNIIYDKKQGQTYFLKFFFGAEFFGGTLPDWGSCRGIPVPRTARGPNRK
jgi:hypothetical protein